MGIGHRAVRSVMVRPFDCAQDRLPHHDTLFMFFNGSAGTGPVIRIVFMKIIGDIAKGRELEIRALRPQIGKPIEDPV